MQCLYLARDRIEAQFLRDFLGRHHIESVILGDYLAGAAGELPVNVFPAIWVVEDDDLDRARALLPRFIAECQGEPGGSSWVCEACGETVEGSFALCWNCSHPRPEPSEE
jgi:hypothetical protein